MATVSQGHIEKRGKNSYRITIPLRRRLPDGSYDRHRETFRGTLEEAEKRRVHLIHMLNTNRLPSAGSITLGQYLLLWLDSYADVYTEPSTAEMYRRHVEKRINPAIGDIKLAELAPFHVRSFFASLRKDGARLDGKPGGLNPNTIRKVHVALKQALDQAVEDKLIPYNPALGVKLPKVSRPPKRLWTWEELQKFMEVVREHPQRSLIITLAFSGLRISEALGLQWRSIDFSNTRITVDQSLKRAGPNTKLGKVKNDRIRWVPMEDKVIKALKEHRIAQNETRLVMGRGWNPLNLVFPNRVGNAIHRQNFYRRVWLRLHAEANRRAEEQGEPPLRYINVHGLRHTFATLLLQWGADDKAVSEMLGHHSVAFTKDQYYTPEESVHRAAIGMFDRARQAGS